MVVAYMLVLYRFLIGNFKGYFHCRDDLNFDRSMFLVIAAISPTILGYNILHAGVPMSVLYDGIAVGFMLFALIEALGPVSGCCINPAVTIAMMMTKDIPLRSGCLYIVQMIGGMLGIIASHLMFYHVVPTLITHIRCY